MKAGVPSTFQECKGGGSLLREDTRVVESKESEYNTINLSDLLRSQSIFQFFPSLYIIFESLELKAEVKHGASRGSKCHPRGGYKFSKIIIKEPSTIELKRVQMTFQSEVPLKTNRVMVRDFRRLDSGVIAAQGRE